MRDEELLDDDGDLFDGSLTGAEDLGLDPLDLAEQWDELDEDEGELGTVEVSAGEEQADRTPAWRQAPAAASAERVEQEPVWEPVTRTLVGRPASGAGEGGGAGPKLDGANAVPPSRFPGNADPVPERGAAGVDEWEPVAVGRRTRAAQRAPAAGGSRGRLERRPRRRVEPRAVAVPVVCAVLGAAVVSGGMAVTGQNGQSPSSAQAVTPKQSAPVESGPAARPAPRRGRSSRRKGRGRDAAARAAKRRSVPARRVPKRIVRRAVARPAVKRVASVVVRRPAAPAAPVVATPVAPAPAPVPVYVAPRRAVPVEASSSAADRSFGVRAGG